MKNYGFWIYLVFAIIHIPLLFIFFYKGFNQIKEYIFNEMENNGYISKKEETLRNDKKTKTVKRNKKKKKSIKSQKTLKADKKTNSSIARRKSASPPKKVKNIRIKRKKNKLSTLSKNNFALNSNSSINKMQQSETEIINEINKQYKNK